MDPVVGMRELESRDEEALRTLVRKIYGDTYSYRHLYEPGGIAALIGSGRASLWGDFTPTGEIASHTGFFYKDPRGDYVESGMSLRHPALRPVTTDGEVWRRFFAWLGHRFAYIHQNTTTYHPLAQRYAERYMRAVPAGFVVDYAVGERLAGIAASEAPMHALAMTTVVDGHARRVVNLPDNRWSAWLAAIAAGLGLDPVVTRVSRAAFSTDVIEHNPSLDLMRRSIGRAAGSVVPSGTRVDLIHVPLDERAGAIEILVEQGYLPVGLRAHATRPHEVVLQRVTPERASEALSTMRLAPAGAALVQGWPR